MKTKAKTKTIEKALSPEEKTILANIKSLVEQIEQIEGGEITEPVGEEEVLEMGRDEEDENTKNKADENPSIVKQGDGTTADDDAEERVEGDQEETTEDAISAVKALLEKFSAPKKQKDPVIQAIMRMERTVKSAMGRLDSQDKAIEGILEGIGVTKAVLDENAGGEEKPARKINRDTDQVVELVSKALAPLLMQKAAGVTDAEPEEVLNRGQASQARKALKSVLGDIFRGGAPKNDLLG